MAERVPGEVRCTADQNVVTAEVERDSWLPALEFGRDGAGCDFFDWLTAVDEADDGVTVVAHLYSIEERVHLLIRTRLGAEAPSLASAAGVFAGAAWHERETHEMFGVVFEGHPGLRPLLLADGLAEH